MYSYVPVSLVCLSVMFSALSSLSRSVWGDVWRRTAALELLWQRDHFSTEKVCDQSESELCLSRPLSHCISVITYIIMKRLSTGSLGLSQCLLSLFFLSLGRWQKLGSKETDWAQWRARAAGTSIVGRGRGLHNTILSLSISLFLCSEDVLFASLTNNFLPKTLVIALVCVPLRYHSSDTWCGAWNTLEW